MHISAGIFEKISERIPGGIFKGIFVFFFWKTLGRKYGGTSWDSMDKIPRKIPSEIYIRIAEEILKKVLNDFLNKSL